MFPKCVSPLWINCIKWFHDLCLQKCNENCGLTGLITDYQIHHLGNPSGILDIFFTTSRRGYLQGSAELLRSGSWKMVAVQCGKGHSHLTSNVQLRATTFSNSHLTAWFRLVWSGPPNIKYAVDSQYLLKQSLDCMIPPGVVRST